MTRDGQGLELGNADARAVAALDFVTQEWLGFGKRFADFIAAADREEKCLMLPLVAASLVLTMYSPEGQAAATRYLARAQRLTAGAGARERAWLGAIEWWVEGDTDRSLQQFRRSSPNGRATCWPASWRSCWRSTAARPRRCSRSARSSSPAIRTTASSGACMRSASKSAIASTKPRPPRARGWRSTATIRGRITPSRIVSKHAGGCWRGSFLHSVSDTWAECNSFMQTHNWWHLALFLIDLDRTGEALTLYDERVWGVWKEFCEDQANAVSLLARLELRGVDVGARWADLATYLKPRLNEHLSAFHDVHYLYGLARAGERGAVTEMLASLEDRAARARPFERETWADCVVPLAHGLAAHASGDMAAAARLLGQAMPHLRTLGGSIAQRALFGAIHLDALTRAGWNDAALAILQADERERPGVAATKRALADVYRKVGRTEQALAAEYQAERLARQYRAAHGRTGEAA